MKRKIGSSDQWEVVTPTQDLKTPIEQKERFEHINNANQRFTIRMFQFV